MFKYGEKVKITNSFYNGAIGKIIGYREGTFLNGSPFNTIYEIELDDKNVIKIPDYSLEIVK